MAHAARLVSIERSAMTPQPSRHRYPTRAIAIEYFYSIIGMALTFGPLALTTPLPAITAILAALGTLFLVFGVRTVIRHNTVFELSEAGIAMRGLRHTEVRWEELSQLRLSYFSTKRDKSGGWMQLRLKGKRGSMRIDSTVHGFVDLVTAAIRAARGSELELEPTTLQNLISIGLYSPAPQTGRPDGTVRS